MQPGRSLHWTHLLEPEDLARPGVPASAPKTSRHSPNARSIDALTDSWGLDHVSLHEQHVDDPLGTSRPTLPTGREAAYPRSR